jgi:hypothetical protein
MIDITLFHRPFRTDRFTLLDQTLRVWLISAVASRQRSGKAAVRRGAALVPLGHQSHVRWFVNKFILFMGLLTAIGGLLGCRPFSAGPTSASKKDGDGRVSVTAELNHRIGPIDRGDRYEDPLDTALSEHGYGETDGGGTMLSKEKEIEFIDVNMFLSTPETSIPFVVQFLEARGAPKGSKLRIYREDKVSKEIPFGVREGFAIYLDGVNLPDHVYKECDSNFVVSEINKRIKGHGQIESHWQGPTETALYIYGDSVAVMKPLILDFLSSYPLCKGARVVDITP